MYVCEPIKILWQFNKNSISMTFLKQMVNLDSQLPRLCVDSKTNLTPHEKVIL